MSADVREESPGPPDDAGIGLAMFLIFTAAILIVTGAVALLAVVDAWWMLVAAFAVHVCMTALVAATIAHAMSGQTLPGSSVGRAARAQRRADGRRDTPSRREVVATHL